MEINKKIFFAATFNEREVELIKVVMTNWQEKNTQEVELCNEIGIFLRQLDYGANK